MNIGLKHSNLKEIVAQNGVRRFEGQLLPIGLFTDPRFAGDGELTIDMGYLQTVKANFEKDITGGPVQVVFGSHDPDLNNSVGIVASLRIKTGLANKEHDGLYGILSISDENVANKVIAGEVGALSVRLIPDFQDSRIVAGKMKSYGPTLRHVALVDIGHFQSMKNLQLIDATKRTKPPSAQDVSNAEFRQWTNDFSSNLKRQEAVFKRAEKADRKNGPARASDEVIAGRTGLSVKRLRELRAKYKI